LSADIDARTKFQIARGEIDGWRGQCLDLYARAEQAVGDTLELAVQRRKSVGLRHLAGQRLSDLENLIAVEPATENQRKSVCKAIEGWHEMEANRAYLAHGNVHELIDRQGQWWAVFHYTHYAKGIAAPKRWAVSKEEASDFLTRLSESFHALSAQLGQVRKRMPN
jgi:hypothetical protein